MSEIISKEVGRDYVYLRFEVCDGTQEVVKRLSMDEVREILMEAEGK